MTAPAGSREALLAAVGAADPSLSGEQVAAAFDAAVTGAAARRSLALALAEDPGVLRVGAPPVVTRLVGELVARGSATLTPPACVRCRRTGAPLTRSHEGGVCARCRRRQLAEPCVCCEQVKPVAGRDERGGAVCARCADRPRRRCGVCDQIRAIARRARAGNPDVRVGWVRMPQATCSRCGRERPCGFAGTPAPVCTTCAPRRLAACAHCGNQRPPTARWPEEPVCEPCYRAALRHCGSCAGCGQTRRLVHPPGPGATRCAAPACPPATSAPPAASRTSSMSVAGAPAARSPDALASCCAATSQWSPPRWRRSADAAILADLATGRLALSHEALDAHPRPRAADYLRAMLVTHQVLGERDEDVARAERWVTGLLATIPSPPDRRLVQAYATWRVLRRLRRRAEHNPGPRTRTRGVKIHLAAAVRLLGWLAERGTDLAETTQADVDAWLGTHPGAYDVRDFLCWAAGHDYCPKLSMPPRQRRTGTTLDADSRWQIVARLPHDDDVELTDRVAGCLVLLYAQQPSRVTAITVDQITRSDDAVSVRFGADHVTVPEPLAALIDNGRPHVGVGNTQATTWTASPTKLTGARREGFEPRSFDP